MMVPSLHANGPLLSRNPEQNFPEPKADLDSGYVKNRLFFRLFQLGSTLQRQAVKELGISTVQWAA
jgi:hypothetical protein